MKRTKEKENGHTIENPFDYFNENGFDKLYRSNLSKPVTYTGDLSLEYASDFAEEFNNQALDDLFEFDYEAGT